MASGEEANISHEGKLGRLADSLLVRHLQASWPEPTNSRPRWFKSGVPARYEDNLRTVAVVGAGASFPIQGIANELADELEKELDSSSHDREVELDRLENVYGLDRESFETRLTALCRTAEAERKVREKISEKYRHRHPSLLTYELLAHLLHHRFLDAIISFNFDELLDQAIEDELGPNEYKRVVTERDCDISLPASLPLYIKMHGTASEPDSLRFTRERYYWTPKSIIELVEKQFEVEHLVVMNVGFKMASFDFQYLLQKPHQVEIYNFDPNELDKGVKKEIKEQRGKERRRQKVQRPAEYDAVTPFELSREDETEEERSDENFLPNLLREGIEVLEQRCTSEGAQPTRWRSTRRHEAIVELLKGSPIGTPTQYASYLHRRTILEIGFAAARGRGVLSIGSMVDDRCGRYYDLYRRKAGAQADSWQKLCNAGGLKESKRWPDSFEVLPALRKEALTEEQEANIHLVKPADAEKLAAHLIKSMNAPGARLGNLEKLLVQTIEFLQKETEIEVHSRDDRVCSKTFVEPVILTTFTALRGWTQEMLRTQDYNELWAVSETGDWIEGKEMWKEVKEHCRYRKQKGRRRGKPIRLLAAFEPKLRKADTRTEVRSLPWGRHNRHMTIVCKDKQPQAAIYFVRRLRAPTVTPVYLSNQKDLHRIAEAFDKLWDEAKEYAETEEGKASSRGSRSSRRR